MPAEREVRLPRRGLSLGATGQGSGERRYKLVASIDRGGMGELFLAELFEANAPPRYVVVKRLLADLLDDDKYIQMFVSEAEVMSKLNHPNIVKVFDTPQIDGTQCLAMEYVRGRNVQQILARLAELEKKMEPAIVLRVMSQVLRGLDHAHNFRLADGTPLNLVHRDVTPGNVLVSFDGDVKLTDFGIAKHEMSAVSTTVGIVKGKARYLAPEQILGEKATPRSDIFSSAAVVVEMITGVPLFDRGSVPKTLYAIVNSERGDLEATLGFRAPLLVQLLNRALNKDPRARLQTARELAEGFDAAARLLGRPHDREATGAYVRQLYADVDDPLARFDPARIASGPKPIPRMRSEPALPSRGSKVLRTVELREVIDENESSADSMHTVQAEPLSPTPRAPMIDPDTSPRDEPEVYTEAPPSNEALAAAAASAHGGAIAPSAVIRGVPVRPGPVAPAEPSPGAVDEALSVLAWLQSRNDPPLPEQPALTINGGELAKRSAVPAINAQAEEARTAHSRIVQERAPMLVVFALGAISGVLLTLAMQAFFREDPAPAPKLQAPKVPVQPPVIAPAIAAATELPKNGEQPVAEEEQPIAEEEAAELAEAQELDAIEEASSDEETLKLAGNGAEVGTFDLFEPRGARVRIDGTLLKERVPIHGLPIKSGRHKMRIYVKKTRRDLIFSIGKGEHLDLTPRFKRRPGNK